MNAETKLYNNQQVKHDKATCDLLARTIDAHLKGFENKIWHRHPVWFIDGNPIVGYSKTKAGIRLMFWSGADFGEEQLSPGTGKFKDASVVYKTRADIAVKDLKRWLKKSQNIQWDYKNIVRRKGRLEKLPANSMNISTTKFSHDDRIAVMSFAKVYPLYVAKIERKGRNKAELDAIISWLTGYNKKQIAAHISSGATFKDFFGKAKLHLNARLITGTICGVRVEQMKNPLTQKVRYLDKLVDELAKGKMLEKILREA